MKLKPVITLDEKIYAVTGGPNITDVLKTLTFNPIIEIEMDLHPLTVSGSNTVGTYMQEDVYNTIRKLSVLGIKKIKVKQRENVEDPFERSGCKIVEKSNTQTVYCINKTKIVYQK